MIDLHKNKNFNGSLERDGYVYVPGFFDELTMELVSLYAEYCLRRGTWSFEDVPRGDEFSKHAFYSDPLSEVLLMKSVDSMSEITQKKLTPTYSFFRIYDYLDELEPHVDRPSCEYSVTINVFSKKIWPIFMQDRNKPDTKPSSFDLSPGDAVVYKACNVSHWREKMINKDNFTVQFTLHYVDLDGPFAKYKYDQRPGLSYSQYSRMT